MVTVVSDWYGISLDLNKTVLVSRPVYERLSV